MRALLVGFVICATFATAALTQSLDTVYTWTDAEGVTHYSTSPPENAEAESISMDNLGPLSIIGTEGSTPLRVDDEATGGGANATEQ